MRPMLARLSRLFKPRVLTPFEKEQVTYVKRVLLKELNVFKRPDKSVNQEEFFDTIKAIEDSKSPTDLLKIINNRENQSLRPILIENDYLRKESTYTTELNVNWSNLIYGCELLNNINQISQSYPESARGGIRNRK